MHTDYVLMIIAALISTILIVAGILFFSLLYFYRKRQFLHHLELADMQSRYENNILASQLEMQEITRQDISREIHDNISLSLTLAKLYLNTIAWENIEAVKTRVTDSVNVLTRSISDLSALSRNLNSDTIFSHGLIGALQEEIEHFRRIGLFEIHFTVSGDPVYLDAQKELIIFRVIQESFKNIIKHAMAKTAWLDLDYTPSILWVKIKDNGNGFDINDATGRSGAGLKNMKARIRSLNGEFEITSAPGTGTSILLKINL